MTNLPVAAGMSHLVNSEIATESCRFTNPLMAFCIFHSRGTNIDIAPKTNSAPQKTGFPK